MKGKQKEENGREKVKWWKVKGKRRIGEERNGGKDEVTEKRKKRRKRND